MAGEGDPDFEVRIEGGDEPARYSLSFGSLLRPGAVFSKPPLDSTTDGRVEGGTATIDPDQTHEWAADGPIAMFNNGRGTVRVTVNGNQPFSVPPQGSIDASCPTEDKRVVALAMAAGGLVAGATGLLGGRE